MNKALAMLPLLTLLALSPSAASAQFAGTSADTAIIAEVSVGDGARGPSVHPETGRIYVANWLEATVSVVDPDGTVVATIATPSRAAETWGPEATAVDTLTNRVFALDTSGDLTVIDANRNEVSERVELFDEMAAWPMTGSVVIDVEARRVLSSLRMDPRRVVFLDADSFEELRQFASLRDPLIMGFDPSRHRAYIPDASLDQVAMVDTETGMTITEIAVSPDGPFSAAADSVLQRVYVSSETAGILYAVDAISGTIIQTIEVPGCYYLCAYLSADGEGSRLYYMTTSQLLTINTLTNAVVARRFLPGVLSGMTVDPARDRLYITTGSSLLILDTQRLDESPQLPGLGGPPSTGSTTLPLWVGAALLAFSGVLLGASVLRRN
jgi:DNA-binding beta-propeller fold protein YncE